MSANIKPKICPRCGRETDWAMCDSCTNAARLLIAHFSGHAPESVTTEECIDLMLRFAEFESLRADAMEKLARDAFNRMLPPPLMMPKPQ